MFLKSFDVQIGFRIALRSLKVDVGYARTNVQNLKFLNIALNGVIVFTNKQKALTEQLAKVE